MTAHHSSFTLFSPNEIKERTNHELFGSLKISHSSPNRDLVMMMMMMTMTMMMIMMTTTTVSMMMINKLITVS